jgi:amidase
VRRLREAGAVILGKTNLPELAIIGATESPTWGITRNPWDPERSTGGSSGGSGAAVSAGLCAAAHASDGAGSIRIPAANCGLVGMKPQRGRVSLMPDAQHWHGMSVAGVLTRTVADQALMLDVLSGPADGDAHTPPRPERPFAEAAARAPGRLRVALSFRPAFPVPVDGEIRTAVSSLADVIRSLGHEVTEADPAYNELGTVVIPRYLKGIQHEAESLPRRHRLQRRTRGFAAWGRLIPQAALDNALRDEARQAARLNQVLDDHDVILSPTTAKPPVAAAEWEGLTAARTMLGMMRAYPFTSQWNATGQPALAIPGGFTAAGLPLGAQLIGRPNDEGTLLSLAAQVEAERPWADRRPTVG